MNDFEWRRQMHALRQPVRPSTQLWQRIDAVLDAPTTGHTVAGATPDTPPRRRVQRWLLAAGVAGLALLAGGMAWRLDRGTYPMHAVAVAPAQPTPWKPTDPRLSGAAIELNAAQTELSQAMQQAPHSAALQRLLARTEQQQSQLRQMEREAG
ncbi:MAG: hypothetical protein ABW154_03180 [Dyella sp.]